MKNNNQKIARWIFVYIEFVFVVPISLFFLKTAGILSLGFLIVLVPFFINILLTYRKPPIVVSQTYSLTHPKVFKKPIYQRRKDELLTGM